jgi:NAD(P)-dependent dehydrogenase (short-subunit alcohol dehydrogenase family)
MRAPERAGAPLLEAAKAEGLALTVSQLDVTDPASITRAVDAVLAESGRIDVLVNNAGRGDLGAMELATEEQLQGMFDTNVFGPVRMARAVLRCASSRCTSTTAIAMPAVAPCTR